MLESCDEDGVSGDGTTNQITLTSEQTLELIALLKDETTNQTAASTDEATNQIASSGDEPTNQSMAHGDETTNQNSSPDLTTSPDDTSQPELERSCDNHTIPTEDHMTWASKGEWSAPAFSYRQDDERVVFVLHSPGVKASTIVHHHDDHQFQVMYSCVDSDSKQVVNHSLMVRFHVNDLVDKIVVDVSEENLVVVVTKADSCHRMWAWFEAGANSLSTERKLFLTEANVSSVIEDEGRQPDPWALSSEGTEVKISSSSSELLELELTTHEKSTYQLHLNEGEQNADPVVRNEDNPVVQNQDSSVVQNQYCPVVQNQDPVVWNEDSPVVPSLDRPAVRNRDSPLEGSALPIPALSGDDCNQDTRRLESGPPRSVAVELTNDLLFDLD
jgi:hypothetical protein